MPKQNDSCPTPPAPAEARPELRAVSPGAVVVSDIASEVLSTGDPVGSSVAVTMWDPARGVGAILHCLWPSAPVHGPDQNPACFADTGVPLLMQLAGVGMPPGSACQVHLIGGANVPEREASPSRAKRNVLAARRALWQCGVLLNGEDVGGDLPRWATLRVADGHVSVTSTRPDAVGRGDLDKEQYV